MSLLCKGFTAYTAGEKVTAQGHLVFSVVFLNRCGKKNSRRVTGEQSRAGPAHDGAAMALLA